MSSLQGERATYRVEIQGDTALDACDIVLGMTAPPGFKLIEARPEAASLDKTGSSMMFPAISRLEPDESIGFEVDLEAPRTAATGPLCARLSYATCSDPPTAGLEVGPICLPLTVATPGRDGLIPPARVLEGLASIPCGTAATVTGGGSSHDPAEWTDAVTAMLGTSPEVRTR